MSLTFDRGNPDLDLRSTLGRVLRLPPERPSDPEWTNVRTHDIQERWDLTIAPWVACEHAARMTHALAVIDSYLQRPARVLDVGCAQGTLGHLLAERGVDVTLVDVRSSHVAYARARSDLCSSLRYCAGLVPDVPDAGNFDLITACELLPHARLVVVGDGPLAEHLRVVAGRKVTMVDRVDDAKLAWLYANCMAAVSASYEDFGLTVLEANSFGKPVAALRCGGFLDTVVDGVTGVFFDEARPAHIADALRRVAGTTWDPRLMEAHAAQYSEDSFKRRLVATMKGAAVGDRSATTARALSGKEWEQAISDPVVALGPS